MSMVESALAYATRGIPVFPLKPRSKKPATEHGFKDATTDIDQINAWWAASPNANIGIPNGEASGLWVLDIDPRNDAEGAWAKLLEEHGEPLTYTVRTGSGGRHYYFRMGERLIKRRKTRYPGIEVCGEGGYVVAPPSITEAGPYESLNDMGWKFAEVWCERMALDVLEPIKIPIGPKIPEGSRDTSLYRIACHYRGKGCEEFEILEHLERENTRCDPPMDGADLARIAKSAARHPRGVDGTTPPRDHSPGANQIPADAVRPYAEIDLWDMQANGIPPLDWLLPGWLVAKDVCVLAGEAFAGKSTTAAVMARALASGEPWLGITPTRRVPVLYFDEEQGEEMVGRMFLQIGGPVAGLRVYSGQGVNLSDPTSVERLSASIMEIPAPPVVILDTVQQTFGLKDANSATEVGGIYGTLFRLRDMTGATFVALHHINKPSQGQSAQDRLSLHRLRDSSAHATQASTVWFQQKSTDTSSELFQAKRRGAKLLALHVDCSHEEDAITLEARESAAVVTLVDQLRTNIAALVHGQRQTRKAEINVLGSSMQASTTLIDEAVSHLVRVKSMYRISKGIYAAFPPDIPPELSGLNNDGDEGASF